MMGGENKGSYLVAERIPEGSVGVEIGVWRGDSSQLFLERAAHLHLVDPWSLDQYRSGDFRDFLKRYRHVVGSMDPAAYVDYYQDVYKLVTFRFEAYPVTIHRCTSRYFFQTFTEKVDWVYVDGLHDYENVLADLHGARAILKPGGVIYGDDYGNKPGVKQAVDEYGGAELLGKNQYAIA